MQVLGMLTVTTIGVFGLILLAVAVAWLGGIYPWQRPKIGEVILYFDTIKPCGFNIYGSGYDNHHNHIKLTLDK